MEYELDHVDEWGNRFVKCPICKRVCKYDGVKKHIHWAHETNSNPHKRHINNTAMDTNVDVRDN